MVRPVNKLRSYNKAGIGTRRKSSRPRRDVCSSRDVIETLKYKFFVVAITGLDVIFHVHCFQRVNMMSNSNYSIGLQRLKPVHTAYCGLHNLDENWSWTRDVNGRYRDLTETETSASRDRDVDNFSRSRDRLKTETSRPRPQPCNRGILVRTEHPDHLPPLSGRGRPVPYGDLRYHRGKFVKTGTSVDAL